MTNIKKFLFKFFILCLWGSLIAAGPVADTHDKKEDEPYTIPGFVDEIVVQGEAVQETATVTVVSKKEIEEKGVKTVAEALELVPGTHVRVGGKGEAYIRIRGFRQREVALLIDGIPVSSPYDGQLDLSTLPVDTIERIEVVKGAASVLYGANAMGGVINIITRKGDGATAYSLNGEYGSGETFRLGASTRGSIGKMRYLASAGYLDQAAYPLSGDYGTFLNQGPGDRENSDRKNLSGKVSLGFDVGQKGRAALSFSHVDQEKGLPHHESDPKAKFWRFDDWRHGVLDFFIQNEVGPLSYKSKVYYQYYENLLNGYDDAGYSTQESKYAFASSYKDRGLGGDLFLRLKAKNHLFKMGLRYRNDLHRQQGDTGDPWERYTMNMLSLPLEGEWLPPGAFTLTYGASFDLMFFKPLENGQGESHTTTAINPQVAGLLRLGKGMQFRLALSRKTRFPTLKELFSSQSGNPELEPMKADIIEVGFEYRPAEGLEFSAAVFHNNVKDLINRLSKYDPYINIDRAVFKGFELGLEWTFLPRSHFSLSYTHLLAQDKSTGSTQYIEYRPKHKVDAALRFQLPADFRFLVFGSYVSEQFYYDDAEFSLEPYTLVDIKLSKNFGPKFSLYLKVDNLFDEYYYESEGYPREGRMIYGGFHWEIK